MQATWMGWRVFHGRHPWGLAGSQMRERATGSSAGEALLQGSNGLLIAEFPVKRKPPVWPLSL